MPLLLLHPAMPLLLLHLATASSTASTNSPPLVTTDLIATGPSASSNAQWSISCTGGVTLSGAVPYSGSLASTAAARCTLLMQDDDAAGGFSLTLFGRRVDLLSGRISVTEAFDVCSSLCCTAGESGDTICRCRPADGMRRHSTSKCCSTRLIADTPCVLCFASGRNVLSATAGTKHDCRVIAWSDNRVSEALCMDIGGATYLCM